MDSIEDLRVSQERTETEIGAKIDRPAAILDAREIGWVRITEFSSAQGDEARIFLLIQSMFRHLKNHNVQAAEDGGLSITKLFFSLNFCDENLKRADNQSARRLGCL